MRIAFVGALGNPLATAWLLHLKAGGNEVVAVDTADLAKPGHIHRGSDTLTAEPVVSLRVSPRLKTEVESLLGGAPDCIFGWWGYRSLPKSSEVAALWPRTRQVLCVDTLPDARSFRGEFLEALKLRSASSELAGVIVPSNSMGEDLGRILWPRNLRSIVVSDPMPQSCVGGSVSELSEKWRLPSSDAPRLVFTGRADQFFTPKGGMRKDDLSGLLTRLAEMGVECWIPSFSGDIDCGFKQYPAFGPDEVLNGTLATYISQFDANLVAYNEYNRTIRRRVSNGLSTRLATALTTSVPWLASSTSRDVVEEAWCGEVLGVFYTGAPTQREITDLLQNNQVYRDAWARYRSHTTVEEISQRISDFLRDALSHE